MAEMIQLPTLSDSRGSLTVLEKVLPFSIERIYWLHELNGEDRGGHRHLKTTQAAVCLQGSCQMLIKNRGEQMFELNQPNQCLILMPEDWHLIQNIEPGSLLLLAASHTYDANDYVLDPL